MSESSDDRHIVRVVKSAPPALSAPTFIIKDGDKYYLTLALWEYDKGQAKTEEEREGCAAIADLYRTGTTVEAKLTPYQLDGGGHSQSRTKPEPHQDDR